MTDKTLDVYYKGKQVGTLVESKDQRILFQYSDTWIREGFSISPFSLPLRNDVFMPKRSSLESSRGLFGVFSDSLPDAWGELLLERYLLSIGVRDITVLDRLAYVGHSGMGALEYYPSKAACYSLQGIDYDEIAEECEKVLDSQPVDHLDRLYQLGGTSGGTRPKILIREGDQHWIIKFPASHDPKNSGKTEYLYSLSAKKCQIEMTETQLLPSRLCDGYFKTERFDRRGDEKKFAVTFAGLLETDYRAPSCDYSTYMKLPHILSRGNEEQLEQIYRVMCFNVKAHNLDDHTKNFSFLFDENCGWYLAPAYDLTYSNTYFGEHTTSVNGKGKEIQDSDLISVGMKAGLKKDRCVDICDQIKEEAENLIEVAGEGSLKKKAGKVSVGESVDELAGNSGEWPTDPRSH